MARQINPPSRRGFWIGYAGGYVVSMLLLMATDRLGVIGHAFYPITCSFVCGFLTARYRPQFWNRQDER